MCTPVILCTQLGGLKTFAFFTAQFLLVILSQSLTVDICFAIRCHEAIYKTISYRTIIIMIHKNIFLFITYLVTVVIGIPLSTRNARDINDIAFHNCTLVF